MNIEDIDIEKLRLNIIDYYDIAGFSGYGAAFVESYEVEKMSAEEVVERAIELGFNLEEYKKGRIY